MGEVDDPGIQLLEGIAPVRDIRQRRAVPVATGPQGELVGGVNLRV